MSENAEEKAKRDIAWRLLAYPWVYQTTLFYPDPDSSQDLIEDMLIIRRKIRRKFPEDAFFLRIGIKHHKSTNETIAYETIYSLRPIPELKPLIREWMENRINVKRGRISYFRRLWIARTLKRKEQGLHDLSGYFGRKKVNRVRFLNEAKLPAPDVRLYDAHLTGEMHPVFYDME